MTRRQLACAAACFSQHPRFLGHRLEAFRAERGMTEEQLAEFLGIGLRGLHHLARCFVPRDAADVEALAAEYGMEVGRLANLVSPSQKEPHV